MYWKKGTNRITTPTILKLIIGTPEDLQLTLVTETDEILSNTYLFTAQPEFASLMQAKKSTDVSFRTIMGPFDANCFLGYIPGSSETVIDLRIDFPDGTNDGYRIIPIMVGHNDGAEAPNPLFEDDWPELWHESWPELWKENW
jgi:hypothetical protein